MFKHTSYSSIIKIFIAGSKALTEQRKIMRSVLMRQQTLHNLTIEAKTFEDFKNELVDESGHQALYNKYISNEADIVAFIFDNRVGGITKHEFDVAYESFKKKKHPLIFVFCKKGDSSENNDIEELKTLLNQYNQYYIEYDDNSELEKLFSESINSYLVRNRKRHQNFLRLIIPCLLFFAIISAIYFLFPKTQQSSSPEVTYNDSIVNCSNKIYLKNYKEINSLFDNIFTKEVLSNLEYCDTIIDNETFIFPQPFVLPSDTARSGLVRNDSIKESGNLIHYPMIGIKMHNYEKLVLNVNEFWLEILEYKANPSLLSGFNNNVEYSDCLIYLSEAPTNIYPLKISLEDCKKGLIYIPEMDRELSSLGTDNSSVLILDFPENCFVKFRLKCKTSTNRIFYSSDISLYYIAPGKYKIN